MFEAAATKSRPQPVQTKTRYIFHRPAENLFRTNKYLTSVKGKKISITTLHELAARYFRKKGYKTERNVVLEGMSGLPQTFDMLLTRSDEKRLVRILAWKRTVGVNMVINLDKASEDVGFRKPITISEKFSSHAKAYANRKGMILLTKRELVGY